MARTDFRTPRLYVPAPLAEGAELTLPTAADELSRQCDAAWRGRSCASVQWPRRRIRGRARGELAQRGAHARRRANAAAGGAAGRRLSIRPAQARSPRLYGPKGDRDGRATLKAASHAAHASRPRQPRASHAPTPSKPASNAESSGRPRSRLSRRSTRRSSAGRPGGCSCSATRRRTRRARSTRSLA